MNERRIPQQARSREKYEAVLDACTVVLTRMGYQKTSMLELSLESGVAVPTIYQYFENKEAIFLAWIERVIDQILSQMVVLEDSIEGSAQSEYVEVLMRGGLMAVGQFRHSIRELLRGVPHALSSQLVATMEEKTLAMLQQLFSQQISDLGEAKFNQKLVTLVRLIIGYFLQIALNDQRELDIELESAELIHLINLYLSEV